MYQCEIMETQTRCWQTFFHASGILNFSCKDSHSLLTMVYTVVYAVQDGYTPTKVL